MTRRASYYQVAERVRIAVALARAGAGATLIERLTGFGVRWIRKTIRKYDGAVALKPPKDARWFEREPQRLLQAVFFLRVYEQQPSSHLPGRRLVDAYVAYAAVADPGKLDVNRCDQIVQLYDSKEVWKQPCTQCRISHLVVSERLLCPICRLIEKRSCRACNAELPLDLAHPRRYCAKCSPRSARRKRKHLRSPYVSRSRDIMA